eukprot:gene105-5516_t
MGLTVHAVSAAQCSSLTDAKHLRDTSARASAVAFRYPVSTPPASTLEQAAQLPLLPESNQASAWLNFANRSSSASASASGEAREAAEPVPIPGSSQLQDKIDLSSYQSKAAAASALGLQNADELQDYLASMILSECVYKKFELSPSGLAETITDYVNSFPPGWVNLEAVQVSMDSIEQHYLVAESGDSMYIAFMGTKQARDLMADLGFLHRPLWAEAAALAKDRQNIPSAHTGFLRRARAINVEQLYDLAESKGKKLVLCGHSLGGAVAKLCALQLLRELPQWSAPRLSCVCFATPAVGNSALANHVVSAGWAPYFKTFVLPEDQLIRIVNFIQPKNVTRKSTNAANTQPPNENTDTEALTSPITESSLPSFGEAVFNPQDPLGSPSPTQEVFPAQEPEFLGVSPSLATIPQKGLLSTALSTSSHLNDKACLAEAESSLRQAQHGYITNSIDMAIEEEEAVELALDHILSPGTSAKLAAELATEGDPDSANQASTAATLDTTQAPPLDGASSGSLTCSTPLAGPRTRAGSLPQHPHRRRHLNLALGVVLARKKAMRRIRRLARRFHISLPSLPFEHPATMFHGFGNHVFLGDPDQLGGPGNQQGDGVGAQGGEGGEGAREEGKLRTLQIVQERLPHVAFGGVNVKSDPSLSSVATLANTLESDETDSTTASSASAAASNALKRRAKPVSSLSEALRADAATAAAPAAASVTLRSLIPSVSVRSAMARLPLDLASHVEGDSEAGRDRLRPLSSFRRLGRKQVPEEEELVTMDIEPVPEDLVTMDIKFPFPS